MYSCTPQTDYTSHLKSLILYIGMHIGKRWIYLVVVYMGTAPLTFTFDRSKNRVVTKTFNYFVWFVFVITVNYS